MNERVNLIIYEIKGHFKHDFSKLNKMTRTKFTILTC